MKCKRRILISVFWIVLGAALLGCGMAGVVDEFWSGMGSALLVVGMLQMLRYIRYLTNAEYKEKVDVANNDERNRFLAGRAWAWAGYLYVLAAAIASIALRIIGEDELSMVASGSLCLLLIFYWVSYLILRRKY